MTARNLGLILNDQLRAERRRFELFRKGFVTQIDTSVVPHLAWVSDGSQARPMPFIDPVLAVGDVVQWVDQSDPFCWAKADGFEQPGNYPGGIVDVRGKSFSSSGDGVPGSGTFYDYDQGVTGLDSIILNPFSRVDPFGGFQWWTGGVTIYAFASGASSYTVDFLRTDIDGSNLTPSAHSDWDGAIVPNLPGPVVDEYINLGGNGGLSLRTHGNIGLNDIPGFHAHAVEPLQRTALNNLSGEQSVIRQVDSIVSKDMATSLTTVTPGTTVPWGASVSAPGPDWLMIFLAHIRPIVDPTVPLTDIWIRPEDGTSDPINPSWTPSGSRRVVGKWGGLFIGYWRSWEPGTYTPKFELENVGPARDVAFSAMLVNYRRETV